MKIQEKKGVKLKYLFQCEYCTKNMSQQIDLERHQLKCVIKKEQSIHEEYKKTIENKDKTIERYEKQIKDLQDKLENIAIKAVSRPTTTNNMNKTQVNNYIQNMKPVTTEQLMEHAGQLTLEHIQKGASGYAEYALEYPLKDRVACVDYARRKLKFKDVNGNVITDPEMVRLAPMFFDSIKGKSSEIVFSMNKEDMDSVMFEQVAKLFNTNCDVKNGSRGVKSEFYHDFIKHVCSGSVVESV